MISVSFVSVLLPLYTLVTTMCGVASKNRPSAAAPNWQNWLLLHLRITKDADLAI